MSGRFKNANWDLANPNGEIGTWEKAGIAVLMDIRDELQTLNHVLRCPNFLAIPNKLEAIRRNTAKTRKRRVSK